MFQISGVGSAWCFHCNLEMALSQKCSCVESWKPQGSSWTRVGRHICQSVASGVCCAPGKLVFLSTCFHWPGFYFFVLFVFKSTNWAATKVIWRKKQTRGEFKKWVPPIAQNDTTEATVLLKLGSVLTGRQSLIVLALNIRKNMY